MLSLVVKLTGVSVMHLQCCRSISQTNHQQELALPWAQLCVLWNQPEPSLVDFLALREIWHRANDSFVFKQGFDGHVYRYGTPVYSSLIVLICWRTL
ncbi:hypothetical protein BDW59DRAFT_146755 [Aspergillus cavernicola]|uniref:Secreted protein n=1 Tax=Aspergillus cavernicola TaxID=176166 RepID=A0ABR4IBS0_9EURO